MPKLDEIEEQMSEKELFLKWLVEEKVNFIELTEQYTTFLEIENKKKLRKNARYSNLLAQYLQYGDLSKKTQWVRDKTIGILYAYEDFKTAPIYSVWEEIIKNNKINTDLSTLDYKIYKEEEERN